MYLKSDFRGLIHPELKYSPAFKLNLVYVLSETREVFFRCFCGQTDARRKMQCKQMGLLIFQQHESSALTTFGLLQIVLGLHSFLLLF